MEPEDSLTPDKKNCGCETKPNVYGVVDSRNTLNGDAQNSRLSSAVFKIKKQSVRQFYLYIFLFILSLAFVVPIVLPLIEFGVFDLTVTEYLSATIFVLLGSCFAVLMSYLIVATVSKISTVTVGQEGINSKDWLCYKHLFWEEVSYFVLHHHLIFSRLDLFDYSGKRRMIISGFFDCIAIAEAINKMGIPQEEKRRNRKNREQNTTN